MTTPSSAPTPPTALLQVRDLRVAIGERVVLQSVSLDIAPGSLTVLMGANGSGKSTLGMALAGHPSYRIDSGSALLDGKELLELPAHERARAGLFVSFQSPPDIPGVKNNLFVRTALNAVRSARGQEPLDAFDFLSSAKDAAKTLGLPATMLGRPVNEGFSGGERKRNELLQLALLRPRLAMLDEIDDTGLRLILLDLCATLVESDHHIDPGEQTLVHSMADHWHLPRPVWRHRARVHPVSTRATAPLVAC